MLRYGKTQSAQNHSQGPLSQNVLLEKCVALSNRSPLWQRKRQEGHFKKNIWALHSCAFATSCYTDQAPFLFQSVSGIS